LPRIHGGTRVRLLAATALAATALAALAAPAQAAGGVKPRAVGMLDCNGHSKIQRTLRMLACSDPRSVYDGVPQRFYDNGHYVGHDEPIVRFLSSRPGSGNDITWVERLPRDPARLPTVRGPGKDRTHWFELSIAPWFSMALCNPQSYPIARCIPQSDKNAPRHPPTFDQGGGGSSFLEVQFYPPGFAPFADNISCNNRTWCASLHINDLECTAGFEFCNPNCIEPTNFAFIQRDGVPTGPAGPQVATVKSFTPNAKTLLMHPGDRIRVHIFNTKLAQGGRALEVRIDDLTTGQSGFMQASKKNGFMQTQLRTCNGRPFNYQPEYATAKPANIIPWAALETNISTQFEIGHFIPCTSVLFPTTLSFPGFTDTYWQTCKGPYEADDVGEGGPEISDAPCWPGGYTHGGKAPPNKVGGCIMTITQNGDLDYDGTSYRADWPNKLQPGPYPSPFLQEQPRTRGRLYPQIQFQTNAPASDIGCQPSGEGCAVPIPDGIGNFYPYWTLASVGGTCVWEFGQMPNGRTFGGTAQYGHPSAYFFANLEGPIMPRPTCRGA
jgi:hypothetical protein